MTEFAGYAEPLRSMNLTQRAQRLRQTLLVLERQDGNVNLCEMKFYRAPCVITADEESKLLNRREAFRADTGTSANCRITVISAAGIKPGAHAGVAQNILTLDDLLES